jgi:hypothetical protein
VHIKSNRMMSYLQSEFRAKYSTTTALLKVTDGVRKKASVNINPTLFFEGIRSCGPFTNVFETY